jgi:hypothetical protein
VASRRYSAALRLTGAGRNRPATKAAVRGSGVEIWDEMEDIFFTHIGLIHNDASLYWARRPGLFYKRAVARSVFDTSMKTYTPLD